MNRRDIIIITVLVNTGLLSALLMMAINTEEQGFIDQSEINRLAIERHVQPIEEQESFIIAQNTSVATDEWDNVLKDYVSSGSSRLLLQEEEQVEEAKPIIEEPKPVVKEVPKKITPQALPETRKEKKLNQTVEITVKRGDALEKIARANGTTVEHIRQLNQLKSDRLTIGQTLLVPIEAEKEIQVKSKQEVATPSKKQSVDEVEYYVIKSGDNPWKIAKQFHVKFDDLLKLNHLDEEKARNLKIGDRIRVK